MHYSFKYALCCACLVKGCQVFCFLANFFASQLGKLVCCF